MDPFEGPIPVHLNLSALSPDEIIGWARGSRNENGTTRITIDLDQDASDKLTNLAEVFDLKGIGFAGIIKRRN